MYFSTPSLAKFAARLSHSIRHAESYSFEAAALQLFRLQYESNAAYRRLFQAAKLTPDAITEWQHIPAVPTVAFKEMELTSIPPKDRSAEFYSSGTTQQKPSRHFHHAHSLTLYEASVLPPFKEHFLRERSTLTLLSLTPSKPRAPHSSLVHMFDAVMKCFGSAESRFLGQIGPDGPWSLDTPEVEKALRQLGDTGRPIGLLGTGLLFADLVEQLRVRLPEGSRVLETGGYKGRARAVPPAELHHHISERLGIPRSAIIREYGMCELSSQAYASKTLFQFPPWARVLIISPETGRPVAEGEIGLIRVIDLANVWSVLAIQTEDLGVWRGDGFELLGRASSAEARGCSLMSV